MVRMAKAGHPGRALVNERTSESRNLMNPQVQASSVEHEKQQGRNQHHERESGSTQAGATRFLVIEELDEVDDLQVVAVVGHALVLAEEDNCSHQLVHGQVLQGWKCAS